MRRICAGQTPQKGFLSLEDEIAVVQKINSQYSPNPTVGIAVNWGRSAIETQSTDGVIEHINKLKAANLLTGLMFSGASNIETPYGIWKDTHMPPAQAFDVKAFAEHSLLTADEIKKCLLASEYKTLGYVGIKIGIRPNTISIDERIAFNRDALSIIEKVTLSLKN